MFNNLGKLGRNSNLVLLYEAKRLQATQAQPIRKENFRANIYHNEEWTKALPYEKIPRPSKLSFLRSFLPGGKNQKAEMTNVMRDLRTEYGDIVVFPGLFKNPELVITFNPQDYEKVFRTEGEWPERMTFQSILYFRNVKMAHFYKGTTGLMENGEGWAKARSKLNPVLMQPRTVTQYVRPLDEVTNDLIKRIRADRNPQSLEVPTDFNNVLKMWALECTGIIGLDTRFNLILDNVRDPNADRLFKNVNEFFKLLFDLELKPNLSKYITTPKYRRFMTVLEEIQEITLSNVEKALAKIEKNPKNSSEEKSVLERVAVVDKQLAIVMVSDMVMAGVDTTMSGIISCLFHLAKNPEKQEILRQELRNIMPTKNSPLTKENMNHLPYLRACIKEAFRLNPVAAGNSRVTKQDLVLSRYRVPKETVVSMFSQVLMRDEKHYPQPDSFIPERWLKATPEGCPSAKSANPFIFLPFGFGPRMCIGKRFAQMELEIGTAKIIRNFLLEYNHPDFVYENHSINMPTGTFAFKFTELKD